MSFIHCPSSSLPSWDSLMHWWECSIVISDLAMFVLSCDYFSFSSAIVLWLYVNGSTLIVVTSSFISLLGKSRVSSFMTLLLSMLCSTFNIVGYLTGHLTDFCKLATPLSFPWNGLKHACLSTAISCCSCFRTLKCASGQESSCVLVVLWRTFHFLYFCSPLFGLRGFVTFLFL